MSRNGWFRSLSMLVAGLVLYFALPAGGDLDDSQVGIRIVVAMAAVLGMGLLVMRELRHDLHGQDSRPVRLLLVLEVVMIGFALAYYILAKNDADEFVDLRTKVDALYFTIATTATVGFGDVHAEGQVARGLVTMQMVFTAGFIAAVTTLFRSRFKR